MIRGCASAKRRYADGSFFSMRPSGDCNGAFRPVTQTGPGTYLDRPSGSAKLAAMRRLPLAAVIGACLAAPARADLLKPGDAFPAWSLSDQAGKVVKSS